MVVAIYKYREFQEAIDKVNEITAIRPGSFLRHTYFQRRPDNGTLVKTKTSRVMVRQPQCLANSGSWSNGMPITLTLGCGTWEVIFLLKTSIGSILLMSPGFQYLEAKIPTDEELFGKVMKQPRLAIADNL